MTNAFWNKPYDPAGEVEVNNGIISVQMKGRTYFSNSCVPGSFSQNRYAELNLLNKRISWTTNVAAAGCGCNAAFLFGIVASKLSSLRMQGLLFTVMPAVYVE